MTFSKVLIAVDRVPLALKVARQGILLGEDLQAQIALIHVIDSSHALGNIDAGILPEQALATLKQEGRDFLDRLLEMYAKQLNILDFLLEGNPSEEIILMAKAWEADILVMGTHGRTGVKKLLMGSVAETVIRQSPCLVSIVREND